jgi:hypothetical protein
LGQLALPATQSVLKNAEPITSRTSIRFIAHPPNVHPVPTKRIRRVNVVRALSYTSGRLEACRLRVLTVWGGE